MNTARQFLRDLDEDLAGEVKRFASTRGRGPAASTLHDVKRNIEISQHHAEMSQAHADQVASNKGQGNRTIASLHADAADHHDALSGIHGDIASQHMKRAKSGSEQNLGEGFGFRTIDPAALYKPFDPREKIDFTPLAPKSQHFTILDLRRVVETVCQEHHSVLQVLRFDDDGFLGQVTSGAGMFPGTSPSCTQLEQAFVQKIRAEHTTGVVELLDQTDIPPSSPGGYSSRKSVWRFRLKDSTSW